MNADPEEDARKVCCATEEYLQIHDYLTEHGCKVIYLTTTTDDDDEFGEGITVFLVIRPPKWPE